MIQYEIWEDILWCDWKYQISNFGRVKSKKIILWIKERILKPQKAPNW